jgi:aminopeptidase N
MHFMKKIIFIFSLLFVVNASLAQHSDGVQGCMETKTRTFNQNAKQMASNVYPGDPNIDVKYCGIDLFIKHETKFLRGSNRIICQVKKASLDSIRLELANPMLVDSVKKGNQKLNFARTNNLLTIGLERLYQLNELTDFTIFYRGYPKSTGYGSITFAGTDYDSYKFYTLSEPYGTSDWWPCKDNPADKLDSVEVAITSQKNLISVSNGMLKSETAVGDTCKKFVWKSNYPIAPYLVSVTQGKFELYNSTFQYNGKTMPVEHFLYPGELTKTGIKANLDETNYMLKLFSDQFGEYPFIKERYAHAQFGWGGGMEHQTCSSMGSFSTGLIAHELAHQWFGDQITCQNWQNIWLNEGFASYLSSLYIEAKQGKAQYKTNINNIMNASKTGVALTKSIYVEDITTVGSIFSGTLSYNKASIVVYMLRHVLGDEAFFKAMKAYVSSIHSYGNATTENLRDIVNVSSGKNLDYFFQQWIYGKGHPKYEYGFYQQQLSAGGKINGTTNTYRLVVEIKQTQTTEPQIFTMPVDLLLTYADGSTETRTVFNNARTQTFYLDTNKEVSSVGFDPENGILKDVLLVNLLTPLSIEEYNKKLLNSENTLDLSQTEVYPNPSFGQVQVKSNATIRKVEILQNNGKLVEAVTNTQNSNAVQVSTFGLNKGLYLLKISNNKGSVIKKLQVK